MTQKDFPILIVEDDPAHRLIIRKCLEEKGIQGPVFEAADGQDGLDLVLGHGAYRDRQDYRLPGLVLLDLKMPRRDGFDMLAAMKANEATRQIPVVILTTSADDDDVKRCYKIGANAYLVKPVTRKLMWEKLHTLKLFWLTVAESPVTD